MSTFKQYRNLEKSLENKFKSARENEVPLEKEDFKDGKLTLFGFFRLKQQCEHIPVREDIEILLPDAQINIQAYKTVVESICARELANIKKQRDETKIKSLALLIGGILCLMLGYLLDILNVNIIREIIIIASWVFVWAAVEKLFFDRSDLAHKRFKLLQILSAKITIKK